MHLVNVLPLLLPVVWMAAFYVFLNIGLFDGLPPWTRRCLASVAALAYLVVAAGVQLCAYFWPEVVAWIERTTGVTGDWNGWSLVMLASCVAGALRLVTFRRGPSRHRVAYAWLSWLLVVGMTATAAKVAFGVKPPPGAWESLAIATAVYRLFAHQGNLAHLLRLDGHRALAALRQLAAALGRLVRSRP